MSYKPQNQNEAIALHQGYRPMVLSSADSIYSHWYRPGASDWVRKGNLPNYTHDLNAIVAACEAKDLAVTIVRTPWLTTKWAADLEEVDKRESGEIDRDTPAQALADAYCELFRLTWEKAK